MPSFCPNCGRKATPRGGWCVPCADERRRKYNTEFVRAARNARKPKLDSMDLRAIELFRREGWDEDPIWRREKHH